MRKDSNPTAFIISVYGTEIVKPTASALLSMGFFFLYKIWIKLSTHTNDTYQKQGSSLNWSICACAVHLIIICLDKCKELHLGCVVRVASTSLFQLHLRVQFLLILFHDVRQVRAPAAFAVIIFIVTIVRLLVVTHTNEQTRLSPHTNIHTCTHQTHMDKASTPTWTHKDTG